MFPALAGFCLTTDSYRRLFFFTSLCCIWLLLQQECCKVSLYSLSSGRSPQIMTYMWRSTAARRRKGCYYYQECREFSGSLWQRAAPIRERAHTHKHTQANVVVEINDCLWFAFHSHEYKHRDEVWNETNPPSNCKHLFRLSCSV